MESGKLSTDLHPGILPPAASVRSPEEGSSPQEADESRRRRRRPKEESRREELTESAGQPIHHLDDLL
jgi:hypothetical protein